MKARLLTGSFVNEPVELPAHTIIVFDDYGQAVAIVRELESGSIYLVAADDPEFGKIADQLGVTNTGQVVVEAP